MCGIHHQPGSNELCVPHISILKASRSENHHAVQRSVVVDICSNGGNL